MATDQQWVEKLQKVLEPYDIHKNKRLPQPDDEHPHLRRCAVLVPLFVCPRDGQLHMLLTKRSSTLRSHTSAVVFPGGSQDESDTDDTHTALREAQEEIGLDPSDVTVIAHLYPFFVRPGNSVYPVVGFIPSDFKPKPDPREVALVFSLPLRTFVEEKPTFHAYEMLGVVLRYPVLTLVLDNWGPVTVWGATCSVCIALSRAVLGPRKRLRLVLDKSEQEAATHGSEDIEQDDNVFGDIMDLHQAMCKSSLPLPSRL